jgi:ribosomal protein S6
MLLTVCCKCTTDDDAISVARTSKKRRTLQYRMYSDASGHYWIFNGNTAEHNSDIEGGRCV